MQNLSLLVWRSSRGLIGNKLTRKVTFRLSVLRLSCLYLKNYEELELILNKPLKDEKHQTRVSLLLELVIDAFLTANRTGEL